MEQVMMSNEFYLQGDDNSRRSVFEETGIHSPKVYFRFMRRVVSRYMTNVKALFLFSAILLMLLFVLSSNTVPSHRSSSLASDTTIDDSQRYDLSADDY
jgi:hypothetical protein